MMEALTVGDFAKFCQSDIRVMSGYNGKLLCKRFNPKKHTEIAEREIVSVWSEMEVNKSMGYRNFAHAITCVYVNGAKEYEEEHRQEA